MLIPVFYNAQFTDKNGNLTPEMQMFMDQLNQTMQDNLSNNGLVIPSITSANLALIEPEMPDGTAWLETTNNVLVIKINGALRKVTTSAYP